MMKTVGLLGGMSWESTATYYRLINETVKQELGGLHSAKLLLYSVDFAEIETYQARGEWDKSARVLADAAARLEKAGADFIVICTNTMHKVAPEISKHIAIPILHIADATAEELLAQNVKKVALLGTKYTMTQDFYKERLIKKGIDVLVPNEQDIELINNVIYKELCLGVLSPHSRAAFQRVIDSLKNSGAKGVILGCTEIGLLIQAQHSSLPMFDTTEIHGRRAAMQMLR